MCFCLSFQGIGIVRLKSLLNSLLFELCNVVVYRAVYLFQRRFRVFCLSDEFRGVIRTHRMIELIKRKVCGLLHAFFQVALSVVAGI